MAPRGKVGKSKARRVRKGKGKRMVRRGIKHETASCRVNQTFSLLNTNQAYNSYNLQLSSFQRAVIVAQAYQYYRIKRVTYKFSPLSDTFAAGSGTTVPYLYFMIDRLSQLQAVSTASQLRAMGAKPKRLDDKMLTWSYAPSILQAGFDGAPPIGQSSTQFVQHKVSPWLSCRDAQGPLGVWTPDSTDHLGCVWLVENSGGATVQYKCERIIEFEFKKPSFTVLAGPNDPPPVEVEDIIEPLQPPAPTLT